jgi:hypothetical protein
VAVDISARIDQMNDRSRDSGYGTACESQRYGGLFTSLNVASCVRKSNHCRTPGNFKSSTQCKVAEWGNSMHLPVASKDGLDVDQHQDVAGAA